MNALKSGMSVVSQKNYKYLEKAIEKVQYLAKTPKLNLRQDIEKSEKIN